MPHWRMIREALDCDSLEAIRQFLRDWEASLMGKLIL